jgi:hypothetical protein
VATAVRQATAALMAAATAAALLTARPAPEEPVIPLVEAATPQAAAIRAAEATTKSQLVSKVVSEVKVRGGKGVLNGTPFLSFEGW